MWLSEVGPDGKFSEELKHARFWDADGSRKRPFRLLGLYCPPDF